MLGARHFTSDPERMVVVNKIACLPIAQRIGDPSREQSNATFSCSIV